MLEAYYAKRGGLPRGIINIHGQWQTVYRDLSLNCAWLSMGHCLESWCSNVEREMSLICTRIRKPFEWLCTTTRFETEACSKSEIGLSVLQSFQKASKTLPTSYLFISLSINHWTIKRLTTYLRPFVQQHYPAIPDPSPCPTHFLYILKHFLRVLRDDGPFLGAQDLNFLIHILYMTRKKSIF